MIVRKTPLESGRDTEIDMIERQMEGGVLIIQPPDVPERSVKKALGGLIEIEEQVDTHAIRPKPRAAPKA